MIDIHHHMLPGLDDGARDWDESLELARLALQDGIDTVVCTPHCTGSRHDELHSVVARTLEELKARLARADIPLTVLPGAEIRVSAISFPSIQSGHLITLNDTGRYALIELSMTVLPVNLESLFNLLMEKGIVPVIAHPERHWLLHEQPGRLFKWVEAGALVQITACSLLGRLGKKVQRFSRELLEHQMVHVIATDAHHPNQRIPSLGEALKVSEELVGPEAARALVEDNPRQIVHGGSMCVPPPVPLPPKQSFVKKVLSLGRR